MPWSALIAFTLFARPAPAMHPYIEFDELARTADAIFVGEVVGQHSYWEPQGRSIFTDVTFANVIPVHRATHCAQDLNGTVTLTFLGGQVGDVGLSVSDSVQFTVGQKVVLFTLMDGKVYGNPLVGGPQGLFRVAQNPRTGREEVLTAGRRPVVSVEQGRLRTGTPAGDARTRSAHMAPDPEVIGSDPRTAVRGRVEPPAGPALTLDEFIDRIHDTLAGPPPARPVLGHFRDVPLLVEQTAPGQPAPDAAAVSDDTGIPAQPMFEQGTGTEVQSSTTGQTVTVCGYFDLPIVMEQVNSAHPTYESNFDGIDIWNWYMQLYNYTPGDGDFGSNWESEFIGFLTESQEKDYSGSGWGTAIAKCMTWTYWCKCCEIFEADIRFKAGLDWRYSLNETLGQSGRYLYLPVLLHELGHSRGLHRGVDEKYDYDIPTVMHSYYRDLVEDGADIHYWDAYAVRQTYKNQKPIKAMQNMGVESYYAGGGLHNATTDATWYSSGEHMKISGITVENLSTVDAEKVRVKAYLSPNRNGKDWPLGGGGYWHVFSKEWYWTGDIWVLIPENVPAGSYYVVLEVTANDDDWTWDNFPYNDVTSLFAKVNITCPSISSPTGLTASDGAYTTEVKLNWNAPSGAWTYQIWRNQVNSIESAVPIAAQYTLTHFSDVPPVPGKDYYYWVKAVRACGTISGFSVPDTGYRALDPPFVTAADGEDYLVIAVTWPAVEGATHYQVWRSDAYDLSGAAPVCGWLSGLSHGDPAPMPSSYYYWVKPAVSGTGHNAPALILERVGVGRLAMSPPKNVSATDNNETHPDYVRTTWDAVVGATY